LSDKELLGSWVGILTSSWFLDSEVVSEGPHPDNRAASILVNNNLSLFILHFVKGGSPSAGADRPTLCSICFRLTSQGHVNGIPVHNSFFEIADVACFCRPTSAKSKSSVFYYLGTVPNRIEKVYEMLVSITLISLGYFENQFLRPFHFWFLGVLFGILRFVGFLHGLRK